MPQPKKPGSSARKPAARKPATRKPAAGKPATAKAGARRPATAKPARKAPAKKQSPRAARPPASHGGANGSSAPRSGGPSRSSEARAAKRREDQLLAAIAALRDVLSKGVVLTSDLLQETVDETVRRGRMTRQDAEELVQNLVAIGRRQSQDALADIERLVGRSASETRRQAHVRAKSVGTAARRAPGGDRALRTVDHVRRVTGLGQAFPIIAYDDLTAAQVTERLGELNTAELRKVRDHERRNANRKSVLAAIERRLE